MRLIKKGSFYEEKQRFIKMIPWEKVPFSTSSMFSWVVAVETIKKLKKAYFPHKTSVLELCQVTPPSEWF